MDEELAYLKEALGFEAQASDYIGADDLPLFLRTCNDIRLFAVNGSRFVVVRPTGGASLPDLKRLHAQLQRRIDMPVAVSAPHADARQRKALVRQGIPFICVGRQTFLPFLGAASTERGKVKVSRESSASGKLSPKAQQAAVWGALHGSPYTVAALRDATAMSASQASDALSDLVERGMAKRSKSGRAVTVTPASVDDLLSNHMAALSSPVASTLAVASSGTDNLPDAGESALAARSMLNPPSIAQKAAPRGARARLLEREVLEGELPDSKTSEVQIWRYGPLFTGETQVDRISLALSFAASDDERIGAEVTSLFGKEYPWHEAL